MATARMTSKGQVTIPKEIRDRLGIGRGSTLQFFVRDDGVVELTSKTRDARSLAGILASAPSATVEEMDAAMAQHLAALDEATSGDSPETTR